MINTEKTLAAAIAGLWQRRSDRYSGIRSEDTRDLPKVEMSRLGG